LFHRLISSLPNSRITGTQSSYGRVEIAPCKNGYSPEQQIQLGQKAVQQVYAEMPVLPDSSPVTKYIQELGAKLVAQAPGYTMVFDAAVAAKSAADSIGFLRRHLLQP